MLRYLAVLLLFLVATAAWSLPAPVSVGLSPGWNPVAFQCSQVTSLQGDVAALAVYEGGQYRLGAFTLEEITPAGVTTTLVAGLSFPSAVVFTGGDLYVVEGTANRVRKVTLAGVATIFATSGLFGTPLGITLAY